MYIEEVNEIALNSKDDKRSQTFDRITSFPPRKSAFVRKANTKSMQSKSDIAK